MESGVEFVAADIILQPVQRMAFTSHRGRAHATRRNARHPGWLPAVAPTPAPVVGATRPPPVSALEMSFALAADNGLASLGFHFDLGSCSWPNLFCGSRTTGDPTSWPSLRHYDFLTSPSARREEGVVSFISRLQTLVFLATEGAVGARFNSNHKGRECLAAPRPVRSRGKARSDRSRATGVNIPSSKRAAWCDPDGR
jgi:hypothetical protein